MFNNIDILAILTQILPPPLRQLRFIELLECMAKPIQWIVSLFQAARIEIINELIQPSQSELQDMLQQKYYPTILIESTDFIFTYLYSNVENSPVFLYQTAAFAQDSVAYMFTATSVIIYDGSIPYSPYDYWVRLPNVPLDVEQIKQFVAKYNLVGIKYLISYE